MRGKRNPDTGEVMEVESRVYKHSEAEVEPTEKLGRRSRKKEEPTTDPFEGGNRAGRGRRAAPPPPDEPLAAETELLSEPEPQGRKARGGDEAKTRTYRPGGDAAAPEAEAPGAEDSLDDAIVGWLVVVDGPGKGQARPLGYGVNSLGRGGNARVQLDFGDEQISRDGHASVTYDPKGRRFYVQHGGGRNLTYVDDEPVFEATRIEACQHIVLGRTTFRFVALCGSDFDWQDLA